MSNKEMSNSEQASEHLASDSSVNSQRLKEITDEQAGSEVIMSQKELADKLGDVHMNILPKKKLIICLCAMSLGLFTVFADQQSVMVALPTIGDDLGSQNTINWAGTASLLANTVCQVIFGRMADIFGRKRILLLSLGILAVADLACGFAQTGVQFYIFRAFAGIGQGGAQSLTMVILSDMVTLKQRGKYQGILGATVGLGNAIGPFIMAAFIQHNTWRNFYHMMTPVIALVMLTIWWIVENKNSKRLNSVISDKEKFKKIDYLGFFFSTASLTLLLIPISGGGSTYAWDSAIVIAMLVVGGVCFLVFLFIEWKVSLLPMIPMKLFVRPSLTIVLFTNFFLGISYYGFLYHNTYYLQIVRGMDTIMACVFTLPLVLMQSLFSIIGGNVISFTGHYLFIVLGGFGIWTLGNGLLLLYDVDTPYGTVVAPLLIIGLGVGWTFQPSIVAAQAQSKKSERAVVIGCRNVLRSFGGAVGIAISTTIFGNTLMKEISAQKSKSNSILSTSYLNYLKENIYSRITISGLDSSQELLVKKLYMKSLTNTFYLYIPLTGICFLGCFFIKDRGLQCLDEQPASAKKKDSESISTKQNQDSENKESV